MKSSAFLLIVILLFGCTTDDKKEQVEEMKAPDMALYPQFGYVPNGKIVFQFYHEYGFTDQVWHLITILIPDSVYRLDHPLPIDSRVMASVPEIYTEKFIEGYPIQFTNEFSMNADVSNKVKHFHDTTYHINISHSNGTYTTRRIGKTHILRLLDEESGLEYVELKYNSWD